MPATLDSTVAGIRRQRREIDEQARRDVGPPVDTTGVGQGNQIGKNQLSSILGRASQAILSRFPNHPIAQIGGLSAHIAEKNIEATALQDVIAGKSLSEVNFSGLYPEQIQDIIKVRKDQQREKLDMAKEVLSLRQKYGMDAREWATFQSTLGLREVQRAQLEGAPAAAIEEREDRQAHDLEMLGAREGIARRGTTDKIRQELDSAKQLLRERARLEKEAKAGFNRREFLQLLGSSERYSRTLALEEGWTIREGMIRFFTNFAPEYLPFVSAALTGGIPGGPGGGRTGGSSPGDDFINNTPGVGPPRR